MLTFELIYLCINAILRKDVDVEPAHTRLHPQRIREQMGVVLDPASCLFCSHALHSEIPRLAEHVAREIDGILLADQITAIASESSLQLVPVIAYHGSLEDVAADHQQVVQIRRIKELPGPLSPLAEGVRADKLGNLEVIMKLSYKLVTCVFHRRPLRL